MPLLLTDTDLGLPPSISDVIAKHLRAAIATGQLMEGEPVRQDEVAKVFNVSKVPVREALKRLEAEGFVAFQKNRGAVVTTLSPPEIRQAFETRAILEAGAMRLSVPHLTPEMLKHAKQASQAFSRETDASRWSDLNSEFHSALYAGTDNAFLLNMIRSINDRIERYVRIQLTLTEGTHVADREHAQILDACKRKNADRAAALTYEHVLDACESLLDHLPHKKAARAERKTA